MKGKLISDSRSVENISEKRLKIEVQPIQTNGVKTVKRFVNVHLHCTVSDLKRISKISMLPTLEKFLRTPMVELCSKNGSERQKHTLHKKYMSVRQDYEIKASHSSHLCCLIATLWIASSFKGSV